MPINYLETVSKKRNWQPQFTPQEKGREGAQNCLERALALAGLELNVMEWVLNSRLESMRLGCDAIVALESNAKDEEKHDRVLKLATQAYNVSETSLNMAKAVMDAWEAHPDHPLVKVAMLESGIFFVILPMYRFFGGASLRTASRDISGDEAIHVRVHLSIAKDLGYKFSPSLDKLRADTVAFLVENLECSGKYGSKQLWLDSSYSLVHQGTASALEETRAAVMPSFFETDARALPSY